MASGKSGSFELSGNYGITVKVTWSETYDITTNKSVVSIESLKVKSSSYYGKSYYLNGTIKVGGSEVIEFSSTLGSHYAYVSALNTYANVVPASSKYASAPWESDSITHDSDGSKSVAIAVNIRGYVQGSSGYGNGWSVSDSKTVELTTIPRASEITSVADITLGNACSVKWTPKAASFRYKLKFSLGDWSHTTGALHPDQTSAYTYTGYKIPLSVASELPDDKTGTMKVTLYTYSDSDASDQIGSEDSATFTVTVPNTSATQPSVTMKLSPAGSLADSFAGLYIQGKTQVKADLSATGKYDAEIESYSMKVEDISYDSGDSYTSEYLSRYGSITVYGYAEDSRGYTGSVSKDITVIPYSKPKILPFTDQTEVIAARCDSNENFSDSGTYLKIMAKRSYSKVISGDVQYNFCQIRYRYKTEGGSYSPWATILEYDTDSDEIETGALLEGALSAKSTYIVQVQAIDDIGESASTTITIPTDKVYMHRNGARRSLTFGGYVEDDNTLATAEDITFKAKGPIMAMGGGNIDCLILGTKLTATADKKISLNSYKTPGNYYSPNAENSQYISDSPYTAGGFSLIVRELQSSSYIRQELFYGRTTWIRHFDGKDWSDWWRYQTTTVAEDASVDYVIEAGTGNGWTYKKWKGGTYEAFGIFEVTPTSSTVNSTMYRTNNMTIDLPFNISNAIVSGTAVGHYWITNGGKSGDSEITLRLMSDKEFSTTTSIEVRLEVVGIYE